MTLKPANVVGRSHREVRLKAGRRATFRGRALPVTSRTCVSMTLSELVKGQWYDAGHSGCMKVPTSGRVRIRVLHTGGLVGKHLLATAGVSDNPHKQWEQSSRSVRFTFVR